VQDMSMEERRRQILSLRDEVLRSMRGELESVAKPKMEFSKKQITGACAFYFVICIIALASWFIIGDWPEEIILRLVWPFGATIIGYMGKSAYENKYKIQKGGKSNEF